jgi:hypothetical protein
MTPPIGGGSPPAGQDLARLALERLIRVLGEAQGRAVYASTLHEVGLQGIDTPDALYTFGEHLSRQGGIPAAVGSLLTVAAVVRGASGQSSRGQG